MMRHPETSKLIKEALSSPVGSTSRAKAKKTFSIINKLHSSYNDGSGGPGMTDARMMFTPNQEQEDPQSAPKGMVIFHRIPTPKINYYMGSKPKPAPKKVDGAGGPGVYDGKGGIFDDIGAGLSSAANSTLNFFATPFTSSPAPAINTTMSMSTPATIAQPKPGDANYIAPQNYDPGLISKGLSWLGNAATNVVTGAGKAIAAVPAVLAGALQYGGQNLVQGISSGINSLVPHDVTKPAPGPGYVNYGDTRGIQFLNELYPNVASSMPAPISQPTNMSTPASMTTLGKTPASTTPVSTTTKSGGTTDFTGGAPSFYSTLGGPAKTTGGTTDFSGGSSSSFSGGATGSFADRLTAVESGGNYSAVGSPTSTGYTALGKYQIMPNFHFAEIGLNPDDPADVQKFLTTPALQDQLFKKITDNLATQYGGDETKMAAAYFGGAGAVDKVGTPEGDKISDGHMTLNQYVAAVTGGASGSFADSSGSSSSSSGAPTDQMARLSAAVKAGMGPGNFAATEMARKDNQFGGKTLAQIQVDNQEAVKKEFNLDPQKAEIAKLTSEVDSLPKDMTDYITARDTYIKQTDADIADFKKQMETMDMGNPGTYREAVSHLNYLYTLRGRQNATYMGYLNDAVVNHQKKLSDEITAYNSDLATAQEKLTGMNAISLEEYKTMSANLTEMYTSMQDAPVRALQLKQLQAQVNGAAATGAIDPLDYDKTIGYATQLKTMKDMNFVQPSGVHEGMANPGTHLVDTIKENARLQPSLQDINQYAAYKNGVMKYLNAEPDPSGNDTFVTSTGKKKMAEEAIRNFAQVASEIAAPAKNDALINQSFYDAMEVATGDGNQGSLQHQIANKIENDAPAIMNAVKSLSPTGHWYTLGIHGGTPTLSDFTKTMKTAVSDSTLAESLAGAIYATFQTYVKSGSSASSAVEAMTNDVTSQTNRQPYTPQQFAMEIGRIYAMDTVMSEFYAASPVLGQKLQDLLATPAQ